MIIQRTDVTFSGTGLPNIFPYPQRLGAAVAAWFSADNNVSLSGSNVTQWQDRTTNAVKVANTGSPNPILFSATAQNGLPGLQTGQLANADVAGSNAFLYSAASVPALDAFEYNVPWSISIALKIGAFTGTEGNHYLLGYGNTGANQGWSLNLRNGSSTIWNFYIYQGNGSALISLQESSATLPQSGATAILTITYDGVGASSNAIKLYINGLLFATGGGSGTSLSSTLLSSSRSLRFFEINNGNSPDQLYEVVFCTGANQITQNFVTLMDKYLNAKWALHA